MTGDHLPLQSNRLSKKDIKGETAFLPSPPDLRNPSTPFELGDLHQKTPDFKQRDFSSAHTTLKSRKRAPSPEAKIMKRRGHGDDKENQNYTNVDHWILPKNATEKITTGLECFSISERVIIKPTKSKRGKKQDIQPADESGASTSMSGNTLVTTTPQLEARSLGESTIDTNELSRKIRAIQEDEDPTGLHIKLEPARDLKKFVTDEADSYAFDRCFKSWRRDIDRECCLSQFRNANYKDEYTTNVFSATSRWVLLQWMRECMLDAKHFRSTYHAAVQYFDIFLSNMPIDQSFFQLLGVTSWLIAIKANETGSYNMNDLVSFLWDDEGKSHDQNLADNINARKWVLKYECKFMKLLKWDVLLPTPIDFLRHSFQFATLADKRKNIPGAEELPDWLVDSKKYDPKLTLYHQRCNTMLFVKACTILDDAVMDYESLNFTSSELAAAVFWKVYPQSDSNDLSEKILLACTGYQLAQLGTCLEFLEPYNVADIHSLLEDEAVLCMLNNPDLNNKNEGIAFRIEEHQLQTHLTVEDYDNIQKERAAKTGAAHSMSFWNYK